MGVATTTLRRKSAPLRHRTPGRIIEAWMS